MGNPEQGPIYAGSDMQVEQLRRHFDPESIKGKDILVPSVEMQAGMELLEGGKKAFFAVIDKIKKMTGTSREAGTEV